MVYLRAPCRPEREASLSTKSVENRSCDVKIVTNLNLRERDVKLANIRRLEVFLAQSIWEISVYISNRKMNND